MKSKAGLFRFAIAIALLSLPSLPAAAAPTAIGKVKVATGQAFLVRGGARLPAKVNDAVLEHDQIETGADGSVGVTFTDNTSFSSGPNTQVAIDNYFFDPANLKGKLLAQLKRGTLMVRSGDLTKQQPGAIQVKTPRTVLGVRGTTFVVSVDE
ncbi:MAG: hypothetical protein EXR72_10020 [Myxococcales bacterium]|nr:hypothetical protein [Myxococcales bacterium]